MNKTQAGRLLTLAYYLKTVVPRKQFDMEIFGDGECDCLSPDPACETSGCAMGWSTAVWPEHFWLGKSSQPFYGRYSVRCGPTKRGREIWILDDVVLDWYGITEDESRNIFGPHPRTPKQEAKVLEDLAKKHGYVYAD